MSVDVHKNFAVSSVATAPSPATSGTSLVVAAGQGALFGTVPFNVTIWPTGVNPTAANAEIVRVTAIATDTLTIVRAQEGTVARTVIVGDQIAATITAKTLTDAELANTDVTLAADRTVDLNGKLLHVAQGGNDFLLIDPTAGNEMALLQAYNTTGGDNYGQLAAFSGNTQAEFQLYAAFNASAKEVQIAALANATTATLIYTADTHTFPILGGNGVGVAAVDNTGKLSWSAGGGSFDYGKTIFISNANYVL